MEQHIRILAILYIVFGILGLVGAVLVLFAGLGAGFASDDPDAALAGGMCGTIIAVFIAVISLPNLIAGIGLRNRRQWARILTIILSILNLFNFPLGTALGVYGLWALLNEQSKSYFT
jgi:hypothetical protein